MADINPTAPRCDQCGMFHPPIQGTCPMAKPVSKTTGKKIDVDPFLRKIKPIVESQIEMKKLEDPTNLLNYLTVELTKLCEQYQEPKKG